LRARAEYHSRGESSLATARRAGRRAAVPGPPPGVSLLGHAHRCRGLRRRPRLRWQLAATAADSVLFVTPEAAAGGDIDHQAQRQHDAGAGEQCIELVVEGWCSFVVSWVAVRRAITVEPMSSMHLRPATADSRPGCEFFTPCYQRAGSFFSSTMRRHAAPGSRLRRAAEDSLTISRDAPRVRRCLLRQPVGHRQYATLVAREGAQQPRDAAVDVVQRQLLTLPVAWRASPDQLADQVQRESGGGEEVAPWLRAPRRRWWLSVITEADRGPPSSVISPKYSPAPWVA